MKNPVFYSDWLDVAVNCSGSRPIVFTNGCFDVFHAGHVRLLEHIRWKFPNHVVVVGLNSDESVRRLKGPTRPVNTLENRQKVLEACRFVDHVLPFTEDTPLKLIQTIRPAVIVKDASYRHSFVAGRYWARRNKAKLYFVEPLVGISTTEILRRGGKA